MSSKGLYEFGEFRLDLQESRLERAGTAVALAQRAGRASTGK
jgi:hypothetical protein